MTAAPDTAKLWPEVGIHPVTLALPSGMVGYTLRAYRPVGEVTPTARAEVTPEDDPFASPPERDADTALDLHDTVEDERPLGEPEDEPPLSDFTDPDEEVPLFLSHRGRLFLFGTVESLVEFVHSDAPHDLRQLDTWSTLVTRIRPDDVAPTDEDTYELDLVVENLRGGHDAWDLPLLISAGEAARDLGHALRLESVIVAMSPGSPLDDLDDALRATAAGGVGGFFARRRLRRFGAQQASLGWRTVIGKIAEAIDWRD